MDGWLVVLWVSMELFFLFLFEFAGCLLAFIFWCKSSLMRLIQFDKKGYNVESSRG